MAKLIRIISSIEGFRRAGMAHSKTPTDHKEDTFTEEQLKALQDEPNLLVQITEAEDDEPTLEKRLSGKADDVIVWLADAGEEIRAQALELEQAKGNKARKGVLKALGVEDK